MWQRFDTRMSRHTELLIALAILLGLTWAAVLVPLLETWLKTHPEGM